MTEYKKDGYVFIAPSRNKDKKYDVYKDGVFIVSFGGLGYSQFRDAIGHYKDQDTKDPKRRINYLKRHHPGLTRREALETTPKTSAKYFSTKYLW
jgi:hypothetical protein